MFFSITYKVPLTWSHPLSASPSPTPLQAQGAPSDTANIPTPQSHCSACSLCLECLSPPVYIARPFTSAQSSFLRKALGATLFSDPNTV